MERWSEKVAVVTGASSGIGLVIAKTLVSHGMTVVGLARRKEVMENEMKNATGPGKFHAYACDVSKKDDVAKAFQYIKSTFGTVHLLVNNAGIAIRKSIEEASIEELEDVIGVNLMGTLYCSKEAIKLMKAGDHEAYIINMNSLGGLKVPDPDVIPGMKFFTNVESPSKFGITALSDVLTKELRGGKIRVTNVSPGSVKTAAGAEFVGHITDAPALNPQDIADTIVYLVGLPMHVQINQITMQALNERF